MFVDDCFWTVKAEDFHENILGGVILVYNHYSEHSVCNLSKKRNLPRYFLENIQKWMAQSKRKIPRKHSWWNHFSIIATLKSQSVIWPKEGLYRLEIFENGWLLTSSYAMMRNVDCIPLIEIKHNFFKKTFFPSAIIEWNKLDPAIRKVWKFESLKVWVFSKAIFSNFLDPPQEVFLIVTTKKELDQWPEFV